MSSPVVSLVFPWPPRELSPNRSRTQHWSVLAKAAQAYKDACLVSVLDAKRRLKEAGVSLPLPSPVELHLTFETRSWRSVDGDNIYARMKPGQDMLVQGGLIEDDSFRHLRPIVLDFSIGTQPKVWLHLYAPK